MTARLFHITGTWRQDNLLTARGMLTIARDADAALGVYVRDTGAALPGYSMTSAPAVTDVSLTARQFVAENPA